MSSLLAYSSENFLSLVRVADLDECLEHVVSVGICDQIWEFGVDFVDDFVYFRWLKGLKKLLKEMTTVVRLR